MRPSENAKSNYATKAAPKVKDSPAIRLPIKKIYCTKCQRLIKGQITSSANAAQVTCSRCGQHLRFWTNTSWRSVGNGVKISP